jgi:hypothetical protein
MCLFGAVANGAEPVGPVPPEACRGEKLLVEFRAWLGRKALKDPKAFEAVAERIAAGVKKAAVRVVVKVADTGRVRSDRMFRQLWLLDTGQRDPAAVLKELPHSGGAIVFRDGTYRKGLPIPKPEAWERRHAGKAPLPQAVRAWGAMQQAAKHADLQRFKKLEGVKVEYIAPPRGAGGSAGIVILTPEVRTTLLEVFLKSGAGLCYQEPPRG